MPLATVVNRKKKTTLEPLLGISMSTVENKATEPTRPNVSIAGQSARTKDSGRSSGKFVHAARRSSSHTTGRSVSRVSASSTASQDKKLSKQPAKEAKDTPCCQYKNYGSCSDPGKDTDVESPYQVIYEAALAGTYRFYREKAPVKIPPSLLPPRGMVPDDKQDQTNEIGVVEDDDDEEDDAAEEGVPNAVRAAPVEKECNTSNAFLASYRAQMTKHMERILRGLSPKRIQKELAAAGYFNYDYSNHTLEPVENKADSKDNAPKERLVKILSVRGLYDITLPPSERTGSVTPRGSHRYDAPTVSSVNKKKTVLV